MRVPLLRLAALLPVAAIACSSSGKVGGKVTGLAGSGLVLQLNDGGDLTVAKDGPFEFPTAIEAGQLYTVKVKTQPASPSQTCSVAGGVGLVSADKPANVEIACATSAFAVGGTVSNLAGTVVVLQNNGGDDLAVAADGVFSFRTPVKSGDTFTVTIKTQPTNPAQTCEVAGGSGTVAAGEITSVAINCSKEKKTVGGTVSGLVGTGLVLQNAGGDDLKVNSNGAFAFATPVESGAAFAVTVKTQPTSPAQTCTVVDGTGSVADGNVTAIRVACATNRHTVGGTVSGLEGTGLVLQNGAKDGLPVAASGPFTFATPVESGASYDVSVLLQPTSPAQTCTVKDGAGSIADADVTNVAVTCTTNSYTVGGTVVGLAGSGLVLQNDDADDLPVTEDGAFTFATAIPSGRDFTVAVRAQPTNPAQTCTVVGGSGKVGAANVGSVVVNCSTNRYVVGGTVTGLAGTGLSLSLNGGEALPISATGTFAFPAKVASGASYSVTLAGAPTGPTQTCTIANGSGVVAGANVTDVAITCVTSTFAIGGTVRGLLGTGLVLQDNAGDDLQVGASGTFAFPTRIASGASYAVTILTQPANPWQTCTVTQGAGTVTDASISNVAIQCTTNTHTVGGTVTGLRGQIVLQNVGGDDLTVTSNGTFTFPAKVASGAPYFVTVKNPPATPSQTCVLAKASGTMQDADVTDVSLVCTTNSYRIGGRVSGYAGSGLVLKNNGADPVSIGSNGTFFFAVSVASGNTYAVTVGTQPSFPYQTCTVTGGTGTVGAADVTSVNVNCTTNLYAVGGTVTGLSGTGLKLTNNGGDTASISGSGTFAFPTNVASGAAYSVAISAQPTSPWQTCTVANAAGTVVNAPITNVAITCTTNTYKLQVAATGVAGSGLVVQNNNANNLSITGNGTAAFAGTVTSGAGYAVTVLTQPTSPWQTCTVTNPNGTVPGADVTLNLGCTTNTYTVGGTLSGLTSGSVVLQDNAGDDLTLTAGGAFTFLTKVASGNPYAVTVKTQPGGLTCTVGSGTGTVTNAAITGVTVTCSVRTPLTGNYSQFVTTSTNAGTPNALFPGDTITESNNYGGFYFKLASGVTKVRITITGAGGSTSSANYGGGSGGTGTVDLTPAFLAAQGQTGFWVVLGQAGLASAGGSGGTAAYRSFNGGGAATDWSNGQNTFTYAAGGGGGSDLRFNYNGSTTTPRTGDPTASWSGRFAVVGGGGGSTNNGATYGGGGGGFNLPGGNGTGGSTFGTGGTLTGGGSVGGALGLGGDGPQNGNEGWAGGGGGGYYGGGASSAHYGGGGGSGYLLSATGLTQVSTTSGTQAANKTTTTNGAFTITVF